MTRSLFATQLYEAELAKALLDDLSHSIRSLATDDEAAELLLPRAKVVHFGDDVGGHEADVVPLQRIFRAGIPKTDPELHGGWLAGAGPNKNRPPFRASGS